MSRLENQLCEAQGESAELREAANVHEDTCRMKTDSLARVEDERKTMSSRVQVSHLSHLCARVSVQMCARVRA